MIIRLIVAGLLSLPALALATEDAKLPPPPTGWDQLKEVPHGKLEKTLSYKTRNNGNQVYSIHLPPGYSEAKKYPVLYLHHGITDDQLSWTNQTKGRAHNIMDNLYALNMAAPMIVVMPDGAVGSQGLENQAGYGKFEDVLLNDLIPHIEATYAASTDPLQRAIGGLSMGGGQTLNFGFKNHTVFNWIGAFSSAPNTIAASTTIKEPAAVNKNIRFTYISCGTEDRDLKGNSTAYHDFLDKNNIGPHMFQWEQREGHSWTAFNRGLYQFVQRIFTTQPTGIQLAKDGRNGKAPQSALLLQSGRLMVQRKGGTGLRSPVRYVLDGRAVTLRDAASIPELPSLR